MEISIPAPAGFDFRRTLSSHGWSELPPFERVEAGTLIRVLELEDAAPVAVTITGDRRALRVHSKRMLGRRAAA